MNNQFVNNQFVRRTAAAAALVALAMVVTGGTGVARADDGDPITRDACVGYNLGLTPDQIIAGIRRNDARLTPQEAQQRVLWPIIEGDCDRP
jgi:hypothetical protein